MFHVFIVLPFNQMGFDALDDDGVPRTREELEVRYRIARLLDIITMHFDSLFYSLEI